MKRKDRLDTSAQNSPNRFQTPDKTTTRAPSLSTTSKKPSTSKRKSQITASSSIPRSNSSRKKGSLLGSLGQQATLTQIDWVAAKPKELDADDDRLDYIAADARQDDTTNNTRDVIDVADDSGSDVGYRSGPSSSSRTRPARGVRFEQGAKKTDVSKRRKSTPNRENVEKTPGRRKSGGSVRDNNTKDKQQPKERDKTLTQMDYVRRYLKIEPDEDVKLDYTYYSPKKDSDPESREAHRRSAEEMLQTTKLDQTSSGGPKRRKLTGELNSENTPKPEGAPERQLLRGTVTPKKSIKSEIPSSQSPESPGFAVISPSQFRGINRFLLKQTPLKKTDHPVKEEPSDSQKTLHGPKHNSPTTRGPDPLQTSQNDMPAPKNNKPENNFISTQRTVVYETDAESDYGDSQDNLTEAPGSPRDQESASDDGHPIEDNEDSQNDDSQELPPPVIPSGPGNDSGPSFPETNLSSDASICYRRPPHSTQFPLEPIPPLNTQKMTELFPQEKESSKQHILTDTTQTQSSPTVHHHRLPTPPLQMQPQTESQSQGLDKTSTEIVPESSPITRQDSSHFISHQPNAHESVVQVESSQPADRLYKHARTDQDSGPRGFMLTSSVMESIPMPPLWMGSQDSVGEPYSEPDREQIE